MPKSHYFSPLTAATVSNSPTKRAIEIPLGTTKLSLRAGAGTFSKNELDEGSQLLIETFLARDTTSQRICDLGCGWGAIGCSIAAKRPLCQLWLCDINGRAARFSQHNARDNALNNVAVWQNDALAAVRDAQFDAIVCNPPVRAGNAVIAKMFDDAQRCLTVGGSFWVVLRTAQGAKSWAKKLDSQFGNCRTVILKSGFRILQCVR